MPSPIHLRCPSCRARIKAPVQLLGHERSCPGCGRDFLVLREPPEDASPVLVADEGPRLVAWRRALAS
jgi:hypothetical protein